MSSTAHPCMRCKQALSIEYVQCPYCGFEMGNGEAPEAWMGEILDGKYMIEEVLGVGGMGMVFRAERNLIGDEVALKILYPHFLKSPLQRRLFQDEAIATAQLNHPNVVTLYDADIDQQFEVAYMAMEILEGYTFKEMMLTEAPMKPAMIYPVFIQVCDGLSAAHHVQIIHRDLKPDNLFLCPDEDKGVLVKILDFGIATVVGVENKDESNKLLGTLRYMAPEQCKGEPCTPQTDLYALGVILYESLTRQRATGKTVEAVISERVKPPNERLPAEQAISADLEALVMQLLAKNPQDRPQSAMEVKHRLALLQEPFAQESMEFLNRLKDPIHQIDDLIHANDDWSNDHQATPIVDRPSSRPAQIQTSWVIMACIICFSLAYYWNQ